MQQPAPPLRLRIWRVLRTLLLMTPFERRYLRGIRASGFFDPVYYRGAYPGLNGLYLRMPERHYVLFGEANGYRPNPDFSPAAYLRYNPDVAATGTPPFLHYIEAGHREGRITKELPVVPALPEIPMPVIRLDPDRPRAPQAVVLHLYYPELWSEFRADLAALDMPFDLYVTLTWRGAETDALAGEIRAAFPGAQVWAVPNRGRDILPFLLLVNAGALDGYRAVCKLHSKKSPHRQDGDVWRRHLVGGILPAEGTAPRLEAFLADDRAAFWVADGQHYTGTEWWGSNFETVRAVLQRVEITARYEALSFPAGSIYWTKPLMIGMLKALRLTPELFETEAAQVDGTLAHAVERVLGFLAAAAGQEIRQTGQIDPEAPPPARPAPPAYVSAFYLPQFHPIPENDAWWGAGYTEWRAAVGAGSMFAGHLQPMLPADLGFYDLRVPETLGAQAALARAAGIDAFCVYFYWFDGRRVLEAPIDRLLDRPDVAFPFYLAWANESWRRNWDGLSGTVLLEQTYAAGFEARLAADTARYMRDPRYQRPDGTRPRFVIYRPEDMPDPAGSVARLRAAWAAEGIGPVELGAVCFHVAGAHPVDPALFDFWIEMPPHGLVGDGEYLFGGPAGNIMPVPVNPAFRGLIYDYAALARVAVDPAYRRRLPAATIPGVMPAWDNTARRGTQAHIAYGANPARFSVWLRAVLEERVPQGYRRELFLNAWNEWGEKAVLEPSQTFGRLNLDVLAAATARPAAAAGDAPPGEAAHRRSA